MTVYAITDTKKGRTGIAPTYLQTTQIFRHLCLVCIKSDHLNNIPNNKNNELF